MNDIGCEIIECIMHAWRNWQTRTVQVRVD